ncbi:hypothetical protein HDU67_004795 [Dinochytrium kinnereticum]|nr:hypothetical protein HDU67_004795 [Dinochytrium kinnereticum]
MLDRISAYLYHPTSWFASLSFGSSFAGLWTLWSRISLWGSLGAYGGFQSLSLTGELTQVVSVIGSEGLASLFAFGGPVAAVWIEKGLVDIFGGVTADRVSEELESYREGDLDWEGQRMERDVRIGYEDDDLYGDTPPSGPANDASEPLMFREEICVLYGGLRDTLFSGYFFQRSLADGLRLERRVTVGCVSGRSGGDYDEVVKATSSLANHGAKLVVWSEALAVVQSTSKAFEDGDDGGDESPVSEFDLFIESVKNLTVRLNITLGVSVLHKTSSGGQENLFLLFSPDGLPLLTQRLSHSFPYRQNSPGGSSPRQPLSTATLPLTDFPLKIASIIGSDILYPSLVGQTSTLGVDIAILTGSDWGPTGRYLWRHGVVRGMENGVTVLRCAFGGPSGVVTPFGEVLMYAESGKGIDWVLGRVLGRGRVLSWFWRGGWVFGWGCLGFAGWVWVMVLSHRRITGFARRIVGLGFW